MSTARRKRSSSNKTRSVKIEKSEIKRIIKNVYNWSQMVNILGSATVFCIKPQNIQLLSELNTSVGTKEAEFLDFSNKLHDYLSKQAPGFTNKVTHIDVFSCLAFLALIYDNKCVYSTVNSWFGSEILTNKNISELLSGIAGNRHRRTTKRRSTKKSNKRRTSSARVPLSGGFEFLVVAKNKILSPVGFFCIMSIVTFVRIYFCYIFTKSFYDRLITSQPYSIVTKHKDTLESCNFKDITLSSGESSIMKILYSTIPTNTLIEPETVEGLFKLYKCYNNYNINIKLQNDMVFQRPAKSATPSYEYYSNALIPFKNTHTKEITNQIIQKSEDMFLKSDYIKKASAVIPFSTSNALTSQAYDYFKPSVVTYINTNIEKRVELINNNFMRELQNIEDPNVLLEHIKSKLNMANEEFLEKYAPEISQEEIIDTDGIGIKDVKNIFSYMMGGKTVTDFVLYWAVGLDITNELYNNFQMNLEMIIHNLEIKISQSKHSVNVILRESKMLLDHATKVFYMLRMLFFVVLTYISSIIRMYNSLKKNKHLAIKNVDSGVSSRVELLETERELSNELD